jgi:hypothetical protein
MSTTLYQTLMGTIYDITVAALSLDTDTQYVVPLYATESVGGLEDPFTDCVYFSVQFDDDQINRQIDVVYEENSNSSLTTRIQKYVRVLRIDWQFYGSDALERSDTLRIRLFDDDIKELFKAQNISLITDVPEPVFVPEMFNQQVYRRYDMTARFNQLVIQETTIDAVASADVVIETEKGVVAECSV